MSNAACTDSFTPSILCSPVTAMYRAAAPKPASAAAWPTGRQIAASPGSTRASACDTTSASFRSPTPNADMPATTPSPMPSDFASDACVSSGGRSASRRERRRTNQVLVPASAAAAAAFTAKEAPSLPCVDDLVEDPGDAARGAGDRQPEPTGTDRPRA